MKYGEEDEPNGDPGPEDDLDTQIPSDDEDFEDEDGAVVDDDDEGGYPEDARYEGEHPYDDGIDEEPAVPEGEEEDEDSPKPPVKGNIHAALRVTQRENKALREKLEQLITALQTQKGDAEAEDETTKAPEIPNYEEDPIGNMRGELVELKSMFKTLVESATKQREVEKQQDEISKVDAKTREFSAKIGPDNYKQAINYLASLRVRDEMVTNPGISKEEAVQRVAERVQNDKLNWAKQGLNPGEMFYKQALSFKFKPTAVKPGAKDDPRDTVGKAKARNASGKSIAAAAGSPARKTLTVDDILKYPERDWDSLMKSAAKKMGKSPRDLKFSDIMPPQR